MKKRVGRRSGSRAKARERRTLSQKDRTGAPRAFARRRRVEAVPWAAGKHHLTTTYAWFLARWAKRLSWTEVAEAFRTTWEHVFRSVEMAVTCQGKKGGKSEPVMQPRSLARGLSDKAGLHGADTRHDRRFFERTLAEDGATQSTSGG